MLASLLIKSVAWATIVAGRTEGTFSVSPSGAATYQIPITLQQGLSTFISEVSLCYDSQSGNGIVGYGWSLTWFSAISIVPRSIYYDGKAECLYQGGDNALALDGMRLLLRSGTNGAIGATYYTENDQGALIEVTSCTNGTPASFTVKTTDGTTYKYGSSTGRRVSNNEEAYGWALDYAEDALGNYISYTYAQEGVLYPLSVTYGKNVHGDAGVTCTLTINKKNSSDWRLAENTGCTDGDYFTIYPVGYLSRLGLSASTESKFSCLVQGLNGDGKSEVVVGHARPSKQGIVQGHLRILQPEGHNLQYNLHYTFDQEDGLPDAAHIVQGDFDGHGAVELAYWGKGLEQEQSNMGGYVLKNAKLNASSNKN